VFTGLVQATAEVIGVREAAEGRALTIACPLREADVTIGASVAVSGVCLTVTSRPSGAEGTSRPSGAEGTSRPSGAEGTSRPSGAEGTACGAGRVEFEAAFETLRATTLGALAVGSRVNLEPSLRVGDPLGGHLVSGHVDGVAVVRSIARRGDAREVWIDVPAPLRRFVAVKGSVALDGVSLTVNEVDASGFAIGLIPHTLGVTTLGSLAPGVRLNLEVDVLARYVARLLEAGDGGLTRATLEQAGFVP
jgi:riboflavin synthase